MEDNKENKETIGITEGHDGSATIDLPESFAGQEDGDKTQDFQKKDDINNLEADLDHANDSDEIRAAKRNRRREKKDLVRKAQQEKNVELEQLRRENAETKHRLSQLERNTKSEQLTRIDKNIEDANVRIEYAKMKLSEATSVSDGHAMVEAQQLWHTAQEELRQLSHIRGQADQELRRQPQQQVNTPDPEVQRNANEWMRRNNWYKPDASDTDSRIAKKVDELMVAQGWNPTDSDYWEELDSRLQKELPHRYNGDNDNDSRNVRRPRNSVASSGREASAAYGGSNRTQFVLSPDRVRAMKDAGAWDNPERKAKMIKNFIDFDRRNGGNN